MKILITLFLLIFSFATYADDTKFKIEGVSLGDSLLDFMSKEEIENNSHDIYGYIENNIYLNVLYESSSFKSFEFVQVSIKKNDTNFIIYGVGGNIPITDMDECFEIQNNVDIEISKTFTDELGRAGPLTIIHPADPSGNSTVRQISYLQKDSDAPINNECYDFSNDMPYGDYFNLSYLSPELTEFLQ